MKEIFPVCLGPIYIGDQGIEGCTKCGGCICCDFVHIDHSQAEYECWTDNDGRCMLGPKFKGKHTCPQKRK